MPVPTSISQLSQTEGLNSPAGSEAPSLLDNFDRAHASFIARLRDGQGFSTPLDVASAGTVDIGGQPSFMVRVTGTTTITSFGANYNGPRLIVFGGALTLTHNATSLILPTGANITTAAGDTAIAVPNLATPTGWRVLMYQRLSGASLVPADLAIATGTLPIANGGTGQTTAANAFGALKQDATESATGVIEIASSAESQALSSNTVAITPARLATAFQGSNQALSSTGYQRFPGGVILQWGNISVAAGSQSISYALAFPNGCYSVVATAGGNNLGSNTTSFVTGIGTSSFTLNNATGVTSDWKWFAVGR